MNQHYRITPNGRGPEPTDAELLRYKDSGKLLFNYQRAATLLHRKPLYKDPKAFMVLVLIVLLGLVHQRGGGQGRSREGRRTSGTRSGELKRPNGNRSRVRAATRSPSFL